MSLSLQKHLRDGWSLSNPELREYITPVPPQMRTGEHWYAGTADPVFQNLYLLRRSSARWVLILCGDHSYRMDYAPLLDFHKQHQSGLTLACMDVFLAQAGRFGILSVDGEGRVSRLEEKPQQPAPIPGGGADERPPALLGSVRQQEGSRPSLVVTHPGGLSCQTENSVTQKSCLLQKLVA